jgi:hypothetical protein
LDLPQAAEAGAQPLLREWVLLEELQRVLELVYLGVCLTESRSRTDALVEDEGVADALDIEEDDIAITALIGETGHTRAEVFDERISIAVVHLSPAFHGRFDDPTVLVAGDGEERHRALRDAVGGVEATHPAKERSDTFGTRASEPAHGP